MRFTLLAAATLALAGQTPHSRPASPPTPPTTSHQRPPAQPGTASAAKAATKPSAAKAPASDDELQKLIRAKFARSTLASEPITIHVKGGVATIEGKTAVLQRKGAATRMARTAGAKGVVNKIEVDEAARQKAAGNLTTGRRRAQVKRSDPPR